jgi:hypothetical protein
MWRRHSPEWLVLEDRRLLSAYLDLIGPSSVQDHTPFTLTLGAYDGSTPVNIGNVTVHLSSTDGSVSQDVATTGGSAYGIPLSLAWSGPQTITATVVSDPSITGTLSVFVDPPLKSPAAYNGGGAIRGMASGNVSASYGAPDLVTLDAASSQVDVLQNDGYGKFAGQVVFGPTGSFPAALALADLEGTNRRNALDVVVANRDSNDVSVLLNDGTGHLKSAARYSVNGLSPISVAVADMNNDGLPDIVVALNGSNEIAVLLNQGNGQFGTQPILIPTPGRGPVSVGVADFDGDGNRDIVVADNLTNDVSVLFGDGRGGVQAGRTETYTVPASPFSVQVAYFDHFSTPDLAVLTDGPGLVSGVTVLMNAHDGTFTPNGYYPVDIGASSLTVADINNDGNYDFITSNYATDKVCILLGNNDGTFQPSINVPVGLNQSYVVVDDFDVEDISAGFPGLAVASPLSFGTNVTVYRNHFAVGLAVGEVVGQYVEQYLTGKAGDTFPGPFVVYATDPDFEPTGYYFGTVHFSCSDPSVALPADYQFQASDNGRHQFNQPITIIKAGAQGLSATDTKTFMNDDRGLQFSIAYLAPDHLAFSLQPTDGHELEYGQPTLEVQVQDKYGNTVTSDNTDLISLNLGNNPTQAHLMWQSFSSTPPLLRVFNGVVRYDTASLGYYYDAANGGFIQSGIAIDRPGQGYTLTASAPGFTTVTSKSFNINPGPTTSFLLTSDLPTGVNTIDAGTTVHLTLTAADAHGFPTPGFTGPVDVWNGDSVNPVYYGSHNFIAGDQGIWTIPITLTNVYSNRVVVTSGTYPHQFYGDIAFVIRPLAPTSLSLIYYYYPPAVVAGTTMPIRVEAVDRYGNISNGTQPLSFHITGTDPQAVLPADFTIGDGTTTTSYVRDVYFTLKTAGYQTLSVSDVAGVLPGGSAVINVTPAVPTFNLSMPTAPVIAGTPFNVTVKVQDAYGNTEPPYIGTPQITSSDPKATIKLNVTDTQAQQLPAFYAFQYADGNQHTFAVMLGTAGLQAIQFSDVTGMVGQASVSVTPGAPASLSLTPPAGPVTAGKSFSVTVKVLDGYGNPATSYTGTVRLTSNDPTAVIQPSSYTFKGTEGGHTSFTITLKRASTATFSPTLTVTGTSLTQPTASAGVTVLPSTAAFLSVSAPSSVTAGAAFNVTARAVDQFGNTVTGYSGTTHFTPTGLLPDYPFQPTDLGVKSFSLTLTTAGLQSLAVAQVGNPGVAGHANVTVNPAPASRLAVSTPATSTVGAPLTFIVTPFDPYGNVDTSFSDTVAFTTSDSSASLPGPFSFAGGGGASPPLPATLATAGGQTITASDATNPAITAGVATVTVSPADTTTGLSESTGSSVFSELVTFTATVTPVAPGAGTPGGSVTFYDGSTLLGTVALTGGAASLTTSALAVGSHSVTASYGGDGNFNPGASNAQALQVGDLTAANLQSVVNGLPASGPGYALEVDPVDTATLDSALTAIGALTVGAASSLPIVIGLSPVNYVNLDGGGNVQPINVTAPAGTAVTLGGPASGTATLHDLVTAGAVTLQGNITVLGNSPALVVRSGATTVGHGVTLTTSTDSPAVIVNGGALSVQGATIQQASTTSAQPAVQVNAGTASLGIGTTVDVEGQGALVTNNTATPVATTGVTFQLHGSALPARALSFTTLTSSVDPSLWNQPVTLTATVRAGATNAGAPTGSVDFIDRTTGADLGLVPLSGGVARITVKSLAPGTHVIAARYGGDATFMFSPDTLSQSVLYRFGGFLPPLSNGQAFQQGRTIPIKFQIADFNNVPVTSLTAIRSLLVAPVAAGGSLGTPFAPASSDGAGLAYDGSGFHFNWQTTELAPGTYAILLSLADATQPMVQLQLKPASGAAPSQANGTGGSASVPPDAPLGGSLPLVATAPRSSLPTAALQSLSSAQDPGGLNYAAVDIALASWTPPQPSPPADQQPSQVPTRLRLSTVRQ